MRCGRPGICGAVILGGFCAGELRACASSPPPVVKDTGLAPSAGRQPPHGSRVGCGGREGPGPRWTWAGSAHRRARGAQTFSEGDSAVQVPGGLPGRFSLLLPRPEVAHVAQAPRPRGWTPSGEGTLQVKQRNKSWADDCSEGLSFSRVAPAAVPGSRGSPAWLPRHRMIPSALLLAVAPVSRDSYFLRLWPAQSRHPPLSPVTD